MPLLPNLDIILICAGALAVLAVGIYLFVRWRRKPKDKEKRRRLMVNQVGRIGDATITDLQDDTLFYSYSVAGVSYTASQDVAALRDLIPGNVERLIGHAASLKYAPQNPANSILVCEEWSGLRTGTLREH
jgi:hypothetical protein